MNSFTFEALGTHWSVTVDTSENIEALSRSVTKSCADFEARFSRFRPDSEVNAFRSREAGTYPVSEMFALLLEQASVLRRLTGGAYDPVVGGILEAAGYGAQSGIKKIEYGTVLPQWSIAGRSLTIDGPIAFDFGGIGKGFCIDEVARVVRAAGFEYCIVDGGGDMYGTTKAGGEAWRVAIEYPGKPDLAAGTVELRHQGLAVSDRFRRRFGAGHHLIDMKERKSTDQILGCAAVADTAFMADCMTSGLSLASAQHYPTLAQTLGARYLVFPAEGQVIASPDWEGEIFS